MIVEECASTNDLARTLAEKGCDHGEWISARRQTQGRGRAGRSWVSEEGNLFLSMVLRIENRSLWTWVPLAAAVACARAIHQIDPEIQTKIKWPNDLWISRAKVGGILCEGVGSAKGAYLIVGIGVNCVTAPDVSALASQPPFVNQTTSLSHEIGRHFDADQLRPILVDELHRVDHELQQTGPQAILSDYWKWSYFQMGSPIAWGAKDLEQSGEVLGLGSAGELKVRDSKGQELSLYAEDVRVR